MSEARIPLNDTRLATIWETAKLWSEDRCLDRQRHRAGCRCQPRHCLSNPAMEMVEEIRRLRRIVQDTVEHSELVDAPKGPKVLINYEDYKQLADAASDNTRGEDSW